MTSLFLYPTPPSLRCPVFRRLKEEAERRKRPHRKALKGNRGEGELDADAKHTPTMTRTPTRGVLPEPGLINPAFEESEEGKMSHVTHSLLCPHRKELDVSQTSLCLKSDFMCMIMIVCQSK